tara:strand:+ start:179 stop:703 length:525 start_codon:yes stop_codon:yes gene_type:complete
MKKIGFTIYVMGLSGCGKTTFAKKIHNYLNKKKINTVEVSGDDIRDIFNLKKFDIKSRKKYLFQYSKLCMFLNNRGINVVISTSGFNKNVREWNRNNLKKYYEIYIESDFKKNQIHSKKLFLKNKKNLWGYDLKPQIPKKSDLVILNNFDNNTNKTFDKFTIATYKKIKLLRFL